ncbi:hypothetical protein HS7_13790 [Sulfolobales archaeon HS-7]|nr:hypothetical protein HS7_13790 [Sulfolobales archaeon HS-7]
MALEVLRDLGAQVDSLRTDKYYGKSTLDDFPDSKVYLIPKSNATIKGGGDDIEVHWEPAGVVGGVKREKVESLVSSKEDRVDHKQGQGREDPLDGLSEGRDSRPTVVQSVRLKIMK